MPKKILIVGGGFAGFWAAVSARRVAGSNAEITLVSTQPVLEIRPRLYEANPQSLGVAILPLLDKIDIRFVQGTATSLDTARQVVTLATGDQLTYDRLVVATGSQMRRPPVPGAEKTFSVDTQAEAIAFDHRLREIAGTITSPMIAVVGAGFTGIELALELRDRLKAHGAEGAAERLRIMLIDRAETIGPELGTGPRPVIETAMAAANIELHLGMTVQTLAADRVSFADGTTFTADAVVLATGMMAAPFTSQIPGERDRLGRTVVDTNLRAPAAPQIFVAGDAAAADTGDGHWTLQSCQHAGQLGRVAGENVARDLLGQPTVPYEQLRYVMCLDLGRAGAVVTHGWNRQVDKTGDQGKALKRMINTKVIYPPADGSIETLLAASNIDLAARTRQMVSLMAKPEPVHSGAIR